MSNNEKQKVNNGEQTQPSQKPKLNYMNKKVSFYIFEREKVYPIKLNMKNPEYNNVDEADYQKKFFDDFGNMLSYNRGIFNRKTPQTPEIYKPKFHTEYDDLTMTSIKDIKDYLNKNNK